MSLKDLTCDSGPDPTAEAVCESHEWVLDRGALTERIKKILSKFWQVFYQGYIRSISMEPLYIYMQFIN